LGITYLVWYPSEQGGGCFSQTKTTTNRFKNHIIKFFFQSGYARSDTTAKTSLVVQSQSVWFWTNLNLLFYRNAIFQTLTWPVPWINQNNFVADITMVSSTFLLEWIIPWGINIGDSDVGDIVKLLTSLSWWLYDGNWFTILVVESLCWRLFVMLVIFSMYWIGHQHPESVTIISNLSPTYFVSNIRHQYRCNH